MLLPNPPQDSPVSSSTALYRLLQAPACADPADLLFWDCCSPLSCGLPIQAFPHRICWCLRGEPGRYLAKKSSAPGKQTNRSQGLSLSYAGSSALARQIQQGAHRRMYYWPASGEWMDATGNSRRKLRPGSRRDLARPIAWLIAHGSASPSGHRWSRALILSALLTRRAGLGMQWSDAGALRGITARQRLTSLGCGWYTGACRPGPGQLCAQTAESWLPRGETPYGHLVLLRRNRCQGPTRSVIALRPFARSQAMRGPIGV